MDYGLKSRISGEHIEIKSSLFEVVGNRGFVADIPIFLEQFLMKIS